MKQNQQTRKSARRIRNERRDSAGNKSRYGIKTRAGNQMYGPGCCGHRIKVSYWGG